MLCRKPPVYASARDAHSDVVPPTGSYQDARGKPTVTSQLSLSEQEGQLQALVELRDELMQQTSPLEDIQSTNKLVDELRSALDTIGSEAGDAKDKLGEIVEDLEGIGGAIKDAIKDPSVRQFTEGVGSGIGQFTDAIDDVDGLLEPLDNALDLLEQAVEDSGAPAGQQLEALADALAQLVDKLGPLIDKIPGLGAFLEIYVRAIQSIAISVNKIEETKAA